MFNVTTKIIARTGSKVGSPLLTSSTVRFVSFSSRTASSGGSCTAKEGSWTKNFGLIVLGTGAIYGIGPYLSKGIELYEHNEFRKDYEQIPGFGENDTVADITKQLKYPKKYENVDEKVRHDFIVDMNNPNSDTLRNLQNVILKELKGANLEADNLTKKYDLDHSKIIHFVGTKIGAKRLICQLVTFHDINYNGLNENANIFLRKGIIELNDQEKEEEKSGVTRDSSRNLNYAELCYEGGKLFVDEISRDADHGHPLEERYGVNEALALQKKALSIRENVLGRNSKQTAQSYEAVADLLASKSDFRASKKMYLKARKVFQDDELRQAILDAKIAFNHLQIGNFYLAAKAYRKCQKVFEKMNRDTDLISFNVYAGIGHALKRLGDKDGAISMYEKEIELSDKIYGQNHINSAGALSNIGNILAQRDEIDGALEVHRKVLQLKEQAYGQKHTSTVLSCKVVADYMYRKGDLSKFQDFKDKFLACEGLRRKKSSVYFESM